LRLSGERPEALRRKGKSAAQRLLKARILLKADVSEAGAGWSDSRIIKALGYQRFRGLAKNCNRFARLTMPTTSSFRTIGTRLMLGLSIKFAISSNGVSGCAIITSRVITSLTPLACDLTNSFAKESLDMSVSLASPERRRSVPISSPPDQIALQNDADQLRVDIDGWERADAIIITRYVAAACSKPQASSLNPSRISL
jgi:hypothetical protein